jgi:glutamate dehydrogenase (NAD(P)+)
VFCLEDVLRSRDENVEGMRIVVQGLGSVGSVVIRELAERGASIVGVSDVTGGVADPNGLDVDQVFTWIAEHDFLRGFPGGKVSTGRVEVLETPCDVLIPAALEGQITEDNARGVDCRLVVEAANGPTTPEADAILAERGIDVIPDIFANAGGVTVSYFEWVQDQQKYSWSGEEIVERLRLQLQDALGRIVEARERYGVDWRTAAQAVAIDRVAQASRLRNVFP